MDTNKLRTVFPETTVLKRRNIVDLFKSANTPSFLRDWILRRKANASGEIPDPGALGDYIRTIIPAQKETLTIQGEAREGESRKFLAKIDIVFDPKTDRYTFEIADLGLTHTEIAHDLVREVELALDELDPLSSDELVARRYDKFRAMGGDRTCSL